MPGEESDKSRVDAALEVVRESPGLVFFAAVPFLSAIGAAWWIAGWAWALLVTAILVVAGGAALMLRRG